MTALECINDQWRPRRHDHCADNCTEPWQLQDPRAHCPQCCPQDDHVLIHDSHQFSGTTVSRWTHQEDPMVEHPYDPATIHPFTGHLAILAWGSEEATIRRALDTPMPSDHHPCAGCGCWLIANNKIQHFNEACTTPPQEEDSHHD